MLRVRAVWTFLIVIDAPGIAAPVGSITVPEIAAVAPCARRYPVPSRMTAANIIVCDIFIAVPFALTLNRDPYSKRIARKKTQHRRLHPFGQGVAWSRAAHSPDKCKRQG